MNLTNIANRIEITFWNAVIAVLEKKFFVRWAPQILIGAAVVLFAVVSGLVIASVRSPDIEPKLEKVAAAPVEHDAQPNIYGQQNILLVLVDRLDGGSQPPNLKGVWLVAYLPSSPFVTLMPLYPEALQGGAAEDANLENLFNFSPDGGPESQFLEALRAKDIRWDNYIVVDEFALLDMVDFMGGIELEQGYITDSSVVAWLTLSSKQPYGQAALAGALCHKTAELLRTSQPDEVLERLSGHFYSDFGVSYIFSKWEEMSKFSISFTCEFPTLPDIAPAAAYSP